MPELPEVRTVAAVLNKTLKNKKLNNINIIYPKIINKNSLDLKKIIGKILNKINTNGKYLLFDFGDYTLISHLRMEGKYFIKKELDPIEKHEHIEFIFDNEISLRYHDVRKFGRMELTKDIKNNKSLSKLAPEPFDIKAEDFYNNIKKRKVPIKALLLDQTIINGLGNIYANEVLFDAKVNPLKPGFKITKNEAIKIIKSSINILNKAIKEKGTTIRSYTSSEGVTGNYQFFLKVHLKENQHCDICNQKII